MSSSDSSRRASDSGSSALSDTDLSTPPVEIKYWQPPQPAAARRKTNRASVTRSVMVNGKRAVWKLEATPSKSDAPHERPPEDVSADQSDKENPRAAKRPGEVATGTSSEFGKSLHMAPQRPALKPANQTSKGARGKAAHAPPRTPTTATSDTDNLRAAAASRRMLARGERRASVTFSPQVEVLSKDSRRVQRRALAAAPGNADASPSRGRLARNVRATRGGSPYATDALDAQPVAGKPAKASRRARCVIS